MTPQSVGLQIRRPSIWSDRAISQPPELGSAPVRRHRLRDPPDPRRRLDQADLDRDGLSTGGVTIGGTSAHLKMCLEGWLWSWI